MEMLRALRSLAVDKNMTIAAVIHQPSWQLALMFDCVLVLAKGGRTAYLGPTRALQPYFESLGFEFPPSYNPIDVALDCVSGVVQSSQGVAARDLPSLWSQRQHPHAPVATLNSSSESGLEVEHSDKPREERLPTRVGSRMEALVFLVIAAVLPFLCLLPVYRWRSRLNQFGACAGFVIGSLAYFFGALAASTGRVVEPDFAQVLLIVVIVGSGVALFAVVTALVLARRWWKQRSIALWLHIATGIVLGPLSVPATFFMRERCVYATLLGGGLACVFEGIAVTATLLLVLASGDPPPHVILQGAVVLATVTGSGVVLVAISAARWRRVASSERRTASVMRQVWRQVRRGFTQLFRNIFALVFDCFLPLSSGLSVGMLFMDKPFQPPASQTSLFALNATQCLNCTLTGRHVLNPNIETVCHFLYLGEDHFPQMAVMATMALGLVGSASALRVFGNNRANARREMASGLSTEAFFLGRSLNHLFVSLMATLLFTVSFYAFVRPLAQFGLYFLLFFLVYQVCAGTAMAWSIAVNGDLAGLMSLLTVLSFVLFGGSLFTSGVAMPPEPDFQLFLWLVSFFSPLRWAYELFYLITLEPYRQWMLDPSLAYATVTYGFNYSHYQLCWGALGLMAFVYRLILPYVVLVLQERHA